MPANEMCRTMCRMRPERGAGAGASWAALRLTGPPRSAARRPIAVSAETWGRLLCPGRERVESAMITSLACSLTFLNGLARVAREAPGHPLRLHCLSTVYQRAVGLRDDLVRRPSEKVPSPNGGRSSHEDTARAGRCAGSLAAQGGLKASGCCGQVGVDLLVLGGHADDVRIRTSERISTSGRRATPNPGPMSRNARPSRTGTGTVTRSR